MMTPEVKALFLDPIAIVLCLSTVLACVLIPGYSMKGALALVADRTVTLKRATGIFFALYAVQYFLSDAIQTHLPDYYLLLAYVFLFMLNMKILSCLADVTLKEAFHASIAQGIITMILIAGVSIGSLSLGRSFVFDRHPEAVAQLESRTNLHLRKPTGVGYSENSSSVNLVSDSSTDSDSIGETSTSVPAKRPVLDASQEANPFFK